MSAIINGTDGITFPTWTTGTRPASPAQGQAGYNTTIGAMETYTGSTWSTSDLPAPSTAGNFLQSTGSAWTSASTLGVANGGTNNAALAVTAGGVVYTDGSKLVNVGAGTSGYYLQSNGASAPTWTAVSTTPTTAQVLSATAGASVGAVGTYAYLGTSSGVNSLIVGTNYAGSSLLYAGVSIGTNGNYVTNNVNTISDGDASTSVSGTWKCMGSCYNYGSGSLARGRSTLFLRVA